MSILTAQNLSKAFGPVDIFEELTFAIPRRARIAIVGPNGVGKTTLLRILAGVDEPTRGSVHRARGLSMGYLPQEAVTLREGTLWSYCLMAFEGLLSQADELKSLEREMQDPNCPPEVLQRYGSVLSRFEHGGGYTYTHRIQQTLAGLGFAETDYQRPLTQLSGGQRTRAVLARLLLDEPDLLLLDEPSNHLDIAAVEWLEAWLRDWNGAVVIVSHDRYFLDQTASQVWEMTPALEVYRGNYTAYLTQREARYTRRLAEFEAQTEYIEKQEDYIRRFLGTQNNNQARGRQRRLERLLADSRLSAPKANIRPMRLRLSLAGRSGDLVLRSYDLQVGYQDEGRPLFHAPDLVSNAGRWRHRGLTARAKRPSQDHSQSDSLTPGGLCLAPALRSAILPRRTRPGPRLTPDGRNQPRVFVHAPAEARATWRNTASLAMKSSRRCRRSLEHERGRLALACWR